MSRTGHLRIPFFDAQHRAFADELDEWAGAKVPEVEHGDSAHGDVDATCRRWVHTLGEAGWLRQCVPAGFGGAHDPLQSRYLVIARETLARHSGLADFAFIMQGLGSGPISLAGTEEMKKRYLPRVGAGRAIAAFALTEPEAGSDVGAMAMAAQRERDDYVLDGEKTWISNGGIADFYTVFARTGEAPGARGISAFVIDSGTPGFEIAERLEVTAPHPLARLRFRSCRVPVSQMIGAPGEGFKIAMRNLDIFRASVAAAALGFARRALDEALARATSRKMFGQTLSDFQLTQAALAGAFRCTLVLGGARSGKSRYAESLITALPSPWIYLATAEARDAEMAERIARHRAERGERWETIEVPHHLAQAVTTAPPTNPLLIDCLTLWLGNRVLADADVASDTRELESALDRRAGPVVLVSNEVGSGIVPDNALARRFRDLQGQLNQSIAARADRVVLLVAGLPLIVKGGA